MAPIDSLPPELLECILLKLSTKDLLLAQRVNWTWKAVITNSSKLQQALFFQPAKGNVFLFINQQHQAPLWLETGTGTQRKPLRNTLLDPLFEELTTDRPYFSIGALLSWKWAYPLASWRRMMPAQPAVLTKAYVQLWGGWHDRNIFGLPTDEIRMGEIFDRLGEDYVKFPFGSGKMIIEGLEPQVCGVVETGEELLDALSREIGDDEESNLPAWTIRQLTAKTV